MRNVLAFGLIASASLVAMAQSQAADSGAHTGPYVGMGLGASRFNLSKPSTPSVDSDTKGSAVKLYGGYQFTQYFGTELGFLRTGDIAETRLVAGVPVTQTAKTYSYYTAVTGRFPLTHSFAIVGRAGLAYSQVKGTNVQPGMDTVLGNKTSFMAGIGARYQMFDHLALALDVDRVHKQSDRVAANMVTIGAQVNF
jgi:outer membrane protein W